jgi:transcriptional regulator with XRE-family HTH domain
MNNQLKDRVKEAMDRGKVSMLELERQTGIPANRMYKWYQQGTNPKKDDADKLEKWRQSYKNPRLTMKAADHWKTHWKSWQRTN